MSNKELTLGQILAFLKNKGEFFHPFLRYNPSEQKELPFEIIGPGFKVYSVR